MKTTIHGDMVEPKQILSIEEIIYYQKLLQKIPIPENVYEYAVRLATMTRPCRLRFIIGKQIRLLFLDDNWDNYDNNLT